MKKILIAALILLPLQVFAADICIKSTSAPNYSSYADGAPVPVSCDGSGNVRTLGSGGGGSTTANQGTAAADSGSWPVHLVFGTTALSLGQALSASSIPVVLPAAQVTALTPPTTVNTTYPTGSAIQSAVSCGTSTTTLLAAATATFPPVIRNEKSNTNAVWVNLAGASATAAIPNIEILPGEEIDTSVLGFTITSAMNCIAVTGATSLTLIYK